jgi:putative ABC transport system ATP-binding protein
MLDAVRAEGLGKTFGFAETEVRALVDVDLTLAGGTVAALLGPSGSGKSTLIKALGLVSLPDVGRVWFAGRPVIVDGVAVADVGELRRRYLGFVFQKANLVSFLTARENVQIACEIGEDAAPRRRAVELLDYLGVGHRADAYPETLSGGEQQRVAIARALANRPSLILADEPTAALDKERGRAVMELLARVAHEQGAAVLVVTHDHRALELFDVTYEMEDGRLGPARTPPRRPAGDAVQQGGERPTERGFSP